jgi:hypothetical protein
MIRQRIYLDNYDIVVHAYYAVSQYYADEILDKMYDLVIVVRICVARRIASMRVSSTQA